MGAGYRVSETLMGTPEMCSFNESLSETCLCLGKTPAPMVLRPCLVESAGRTGSGMRLFVFKS